MVSVMGRVILVLGDQLSLSLSSLRQRQAGDCVLLAEVRDEAGYVKHHQQKIVLLFSAMRHFAAALQQQAIDVHYIDYDRGVTCLCDAVAQLLRQRSDLTEVVVTQAGEYRLAQDMASWATRLHCPVTILEDDRFICSQAHFAQWASVRKQLRMEYFYRDMRRYTGLLMAGNDPIGGQWNYDADNRASLPADIELPHPLTFTPDDITRDVIGLVKQHFASHIGNADDFSYAVTSKDARRAFLHFVQQQLPLFGRYQDAMKLDAPFVFHSVAAPYLNCGLLDARWVCQQVEQAYHAGTVPLSAAEGFIRQIIGWREYVRGVYWLWMPQYASHNYLQATTPLPWFYWTGQTKMRCMQQAIAHTIQHAYSHHIQRLMVTGNFALLAGLSISQVTDWYLAVYADAYEWVELPNTLGMALFADGGGMASKPYAASGNYIHKMSNYCRHCHYQVQETTGANACPFNALYWDFLARHEALLGRNPRLALTYQQWRRKPIEQQQAIRAKAAELLITLEQL